MTHTIIHILVSLLLVTIQMPFRISKHTQICVVFSNLANIVVTTVQ